MFQQVTRILSIALLVIASNALLAADQASRPLSAGAASKAAVKLTDAELDQVTAGGVTVILFNPGPEHPLISEPSHTICINCTGGGSSTPFGIVITPSGKFITIGR